MRTRKPFLFILLCFTSLTKIEALSNRLDTLLEAAKMMGIASERVSDNRSKVYINDGVYEVYVYDPVDIEGKRVIDNSSKDQNYSSNSTLSKLYVCVNCVFAEWIRDELVKLIEPLPVFYRSEFRQAYDYVFVNYYLNESENISNILDKTEKFIDVLLNFQNIFLNGMHDTSNDTRVLTALLSLRFKFEYMQRESTARVEKSDVNAIRLILGEINSIQHFVYLNCELSSRYDNRHLYGLTARNDGLGEFFIDEFFDDTISPLGLNSTSCCDAKKMLWLHVARPFGRTKWHTKNGYTYVENAVQRIVKSYDLLKVYWYLEKMFSTILKHLFTVTLEHFKKYHLTQKIVDKFKIVHSTALSGVSNLPSEVIRCFSLLQSNIGLTYSKDNALAKAIKGYVHTLYNITLSIDSNAAGGAANVKIYPISTMNEFLDYLIAYGDHFKCFVRLFEHLRGQYEGVYYRPFVNSSDVSATIERGVDKEEFRPESDDRIHEFELDRLDVLEKNRRRQYDFLNNEGCKYFGNLYHICLHASIELNLAYSENYVSESLDYYPRIQHNLTKLKEALIELTADYWYLPHFKTVFNIIPQIELKPTEYFQNKHYEDLRRMVYAIMAELNSYSVEFCNPPAHNFMFFNNIQFDMTGKLTLLYNQVRQSMQTLKNSIVNFPEQKYLKTDVFQSLFTTDGFQTYDAVIRVSWKGGNKSITYIFNHLSSVTVSSIDLYSFYDVSLKFIFAAICFELHRVVGEVPTQSKESDVKYSLMDDADAKKFPKKYANIIKMTKKYATFSSQNDRKSVTRRVTKELAKIGVFVEFKKSIPLKLENKARTNEHNSYLADLDLIVRKVGKLSDLSIQVNESIGILSNIENKF